MPAVSDEVPSAPPAPIPPGKTGQPQWRPRFNPWLIALVVTLASFMEVLDTSIANVALPHIAGNLSASEDEATWVLTSYLVSCGRAVRERLGWHQCEQHRRRNARFHVIGQHHGEPAGRQTGGFFPCHRPWRSEERRV